MKSQDMNYYFRAITLKNVYLIKYTHTHTHTHTYTCLVFFKGEIPNYFYRVSLLLEGKRKSPPKTAR